MIDADGVAAVYGGCTSPETAAAIEITEAAKIPLLSPLAQDTSLTQTGNRYFMRISQTAKTFSANAAEWISKKRAAKSVYILARNDNYGQSLADAFEAKSKELRVKILGRVAYEPNGKDFKPILSKVAEAKPDFVSILGFYTDTGLIMKQMGELQIKLPTFANTSPAIKQFRDIAGPAANGAYGALYYLAGSINTDHGRSFRQGLAGEVRPPADAIRGHGIRWHVRSGRRDQTGRGVRQAQFGRASRRHSRHQGLRRSHRLDHDAAERRRDTSTALRTAPGRRVEARLPDELNPSAGAQPWTSSSN